VTRSRHQDNTIATQSFEHVDDSQAEIVCSFDPNRVLNTMAFRNTIFTDFDVKLERTLVIDQNPIFMVCRSNVSLQDRHDIILRIQTT